MVFARLKFLTLGFGIRSELDEVGVTANNFCYNISLVYFKHNAGNENIIFFPRFDQHLSQVMLLA